MSAEIVSWYCHTCGRTHKHTVTQRDAHRSSLMARYAAEIDWANRTRLTERPYVERNCSDLVAEAEKQGVPLSERERGEVVVKP